MRMDPAGIRISKPFLDRRGESRLFGELVERP